jgi:hypothetical protein
LAFDRQLLQSKAGGLFFLFGTIYAATFAVGSNWNYRLIFLIPTLPFAFESTRNPVHFPWGLAYILIFFAFCSRRIPFPDVGYKSLAAQAVTVALFFLVLRILVEQGKSHLKGKTEPAAPHALAVLEVSAIQSGNGH